MQLTGVVLAAALLAAPTVAAQTPTDSLPLHLFDYDRSTPLDVRDSFVRASEGVSIRALSYRSPGGGRATGYLLVPGGRGPFAGVVIQHGMPSRAEDMLRMATSIAREGAVVIAIDAPFARRRGPAVRFTADDSTEQVTLMQDLQRAVDLLVARRDVDSSRLAYAGVSYGGAMGALLAGVERRLKTYLLIVGDGGLVTHFTGPEDVDGPLAELTAERRERWLAAMRPIEPIRFVHRAAPATILFQSGRTDVLVPPADARRLHAAASEPKRIEWFDGGHGLGPAARERQLAWLRATIGTRTPASRG